MQSHRIITSGVSKKTAAQPVTNGNRRFAAGPLATAIWVCLHTGNASAGGAGWLDDPLLTQKHIVSEPVHACESPVPHDRELSLVEAVQFALCNNPQTRQSWANVMERAAILGTGRAAYLPTVDGAIALTRSFSKTQYFKGAQETVTTPSTSLSYLLLDFGGRAATVEVDKQGLIAADYIHNAILQNVMFSTIQAYYQLYAAQTGVKAANENVKSSKESLNAAISRLKIGVATVADRLQAETAYAQAVLQQKQAENVARTDLGVLANVLGITPDYEFKISSKDPQIMAANFSESVSELLKKAKETRPDVVAGEAQVAAARANIDLQKSRDLPTVTLSASRDYNTINSGPYLNSASSAITATLHIPLFTGFSNAYQIKEAEDALEVQKAQQDTTENSVLLDVWKTHVNFQTAQETLASSKTLLASAKKSQQVSLGRYKAGVGIITDLLAVQAQLASARQQYVQAQYNWLIAKADLLRALGKLDRRSVAE